MNIETLNPVAAGTDRLSQDETQKIPLEQLPPQAGSQDSSTANIGEVFETLIQITHEGQQGFQHAAQQVHDRGLRDELHKFARERRSMVAELKQAMVAVGEAAPEPRGTLAAVFHRGWMSVRSLLTEERDDQSVLEEVERGEDAAVAAYQVALTQSRMLPLAAKSTVQALAQKVQRAHDRMRSLHDSGLYRHVTH